MVHHGHRKIANLHKRGNVFCYRVKIPARFNSSVSIKEIRRSLKTSDFEVAKSKALILNASFTGLFLLLDKMDKKTLNEQVMERR